MYVFRKLLRVIREPIKINKYTYVHRYINTSNFLSQNKTELRKLEASQGIDMVWWRDSRRRCFETRRLHKSKCHPIIIAFERRGAWNNISVRTLKGIEEPSTLVVVACFYQIELRRFNSLTERLKCKFIIIFHLLSLDIVASNVQEYVPFYWIIAKVERIAMKTSQDTHTEITFWTICCQLIFVNVGFYSAL